MQTMMRTAIFSLFVFGVLLSACKNSGKSKKSDISDATGWSYNDRNGTGYRVVKEAEQKTGPGLVFIQGGTFMMGATDEDVMREWNNIPSRKTVSSFYIDRTEVANVHYREYLYWIGKVFQDDTSIMKNALPDTLCWRDELANNEPYVEYYFRHPAYNYYPVVGVTWRQAHDYCLWRGDRVNEKLLWDKKITNKKAELQKALNGASDGDIFNTKAYLVGAYEATPGTAMRGKNSKYRDPITKQPIGHISMEDGILFPEYRLPTEAEWEFAALAYIDQNPQPRRSEKKRGEELQANKQVYPWSQNPNGLRENRRGSWQGQFLANFKRGSGDLMGVSGGLNDRASVTANVKSYYPNAYGLYNMAGNVSEWVADVYRPLNGQDNSEFNPYRGNAFQKTLTDPATGEVVKDNMGRLKTETVSDEESKNRRNYQKGYVMNYLDGDSLSQTFYGYGFTTLIGDYSRVYKGGSWNDYAYYLSPGTRRHLEEFQSSSSIGFRCAMDRVGSQEGNGFKTGNFFGNRKQNKRKR